MTEADLDVEPLLDIHLRRTLREVASTIPDGVATWEDAASRADVVRLATAAPSTRGSRRQWVWLGAAAAAGAVTGAGLMVIADRDAGIGTVPAAATMPAAAPDPDMFRLANGCAGVHGRQQFGESMSAVVFAPTESARNGTVLVSIGDTFFTCRVSADGDAVWSDDSFVGEIEADPPGAEEVQVLDVRSETSRSALVGPGRIRIAGRVGGAVESIEVVLPDGATSAGEVVSGWFVAEARVAPDVPMLDVRLEWRTRSGATSSGRVDQLGTEAAPESCADETDCDVLFEITEG